MLNGQAVFDQSIMDVSGCELPGTGRVKSMQKRITKTIKQVEEIDVQVPYFYKHDFMLDDMDVVEYGMIDNDHSVSIIKEENYRDGKLKLTMDIEETGIDKACDSYFSEEYKSNEEEFYDVYGEFFRKLRSAGFEQ